MNVWILAARPKTLWAAVSPVIIGIAMAVKSDAFHFLSALAALFGAVMIQIGTNYTNDYFDFKKGADTDNRLGPTRATQAGLVSPGAMRTATLVVFGLAVVAGIYLVWRGGIPILVIGLLSILFGVLYTAGRYALGYTGLADLFVLIFFGPVAVGGTYFVQTLTINWTVIIAGIAPGLFSVAILSVNNLRDIDNDRAAGKKTLPVRFGSAFAKYEYLLAIIVASLIPVLLYSLNGEQVATVACAVVIPFAVPAFKTAFSSEGKILNDVLATTGKLLLMYAVIFSIGWNL
ncbi:MAG: 1,4-dihydroxy-2-naphthoate polyprenyltransferase [Candidatus Zixiibacteriota bacterium]|nr:MAG: 1,4-dihydroxy-2-naphthoate polyprenyltransferase [candidate division Zixibacteria bacterium]